MAILKKIENSDKWIFWCPGCECGHTIDPSRWQWNGDKEKPTVTPSILHHRTIGTPRCHIQVTAGRIMYYGDSEHAFSGKTIDMIDMDTLGELSDWNKKILVLPVMRLIYLKS